MDEENATTNGAAGNEPRLGQRMARGTLAQQGGTVAAIITGLITTTALGRSLTLGEFGVYGFVVAFASYLYFIAGTVETAAVNEMAATKHEAERDRAFTRAIVVYAALGALAGLLVAVGGSLLVGILDVSGALEHQARLGALAVGVLTAFGWIAKVFQDLLRATHRFTAAAGCEATGSVLLCVAVLTALALDAPLWTLIAAGAAIPLYVGAAAVVMVTILRVHWSFRPREIHRGELRRFLTFSSGVFAIAASDLVISSLDRVVVGVFRSAATLGLYEAAIRLNNLVRFWAGNFSVTLLPVLTGFRADDDRERERDALLFGTRYILPAVVGPTVTLMVLSDRVLDVWLGERFVAAGPTLTIFLATWLVAPNLSVASTMLIVERRLRQLAIYSWATAAVNLILSIALTAAFGLIGVAIGTTLGYLLLTPYFASFAFAGRGVTAADFWRLVWKPSYGLAVLLAAGLIAIRSAFPLNELIPVILVAATGLVAYWATFFVLVLDPGERAFVRGVLVRGS